MQQQQQKGKKGLEEAKKNSNSCCVNAVVTAVGVAASVPRAVSSGVSTANDCASYCVDRYVCCRPARRWIYDTATDNMLTKYILPTVVTESVGSGLKRIGLVNQNYVGNGRCTYSGSGSVIAGGVIAGSWRSHDGSDCESSSDEAAFPVSHIHRKKRESGAGSGGGGFASGPTPQAMSRQQSRTAGHGLASSSSHVSRASGKTYRSHGAGSTTTL